MLGICLCNFKECPKSQECLRYLAIKKADETSCYANFKQVCNKENNYQCLWEIPKYNKL